MTLKRLALWPFRLRLARRVHVPKLPYEDLRCSGGEPQAPAKIFDD